MRILTFLLFSFGAFWFQGNSYSTNFPGTENPISEGGKWINGATTGIAWSNVRTTAGTAYGTQSGTAAGDANYADSTAVLSGSWGPDQEASATIFVKNPPSSGTIFEEVELRLRTTITANSITGYEINCSVSTNSNNYYLQVVRWNGPINNWTPIGGAGADHCRDGDTIKASIKGSTISVYHNGNLVATVSDNTFTTGSPGMGFFLQGTTGTNANYGFTSFAADDGNGGPAPPVNLKAIVH